MNAEMKAFKDFSDLLSKGSVLQDIIDFRNKNINDYINFIQEEIYLDIFRITKDKVIISDLQERYFNNQNLKYNGGAV